RIVLADFDGDPEPYLPAVLAAEEPEVVVRDGALHAPRLVRAESDLAGTAQGETIRFDASGTTLVTGATGTLGRLVARHLVTRHGVRRLLLVSRRGAAASGADALRAELADLGAEVTLAACDLSDLGAARELLDGHDVRAVVHLAGVLDDATIGSLT